MIKSANALDPHGDPEGIVLAPDELSATASTVILCKDIADVLERQYPGWMWAVSPDERGGVIDIRSMRCSGQVGYTIHTAKVQEDPQRKRAVEAGGQILERFGFERRPYDPQRYAAAQKRAFFQTPDVSDMSRRAQRDFRTRSIKTGMANGRARIITDTDIARARRELQAGR